MADENAQAPAETPVSEDRTIPAPEAPTVSAQEAKVVGDEAIADAVESPIEVEVHQDEVPAQVAQPREPDTETVQVHETSVKLDRVITDPSSPLAVQVPDAGRGSLDLPIHGLDQPTVEEVFASKAASSDDE